MLTRGRLLQTDDRAEQDRFAGAGTSDDAEYFTAEHFEIDVVVQHAAAQACQQALDSDDHVGLGLTGS